MNKLQHTTVFKAFKRVLKHIETRTKGTQTPFSNLEEDIQKMREDMTGLYRDKHILKKDTE